VPTAAENDDLNAAAALLDEAPGNLTGIDENVAAPREPDNSVQPQ
jgi:hypothetical protein